MIASALDTVFEAQLRALVYLFLLDRPTSADYLGALDTLTCNAQTFGLGVADINGRHRLASGELQTRTCLLTAALRQLALHRLVQLDREISPDSFAITPTGTKLVNSLNTDYAQQLFETALETLERIEGKSLNDLDQIITTAASGGER